MLIFVSGPSHQCHLVIDCIATRMSVSVAAASALIAVENGSLRCMRVAVSGAPADWFLLNTLNSANLNSAVKRTRAIVRFIWQ